MQAENSLLPVALKEGAGTEDDQTLDFNRLVHLVDEAGLIRLGLKLMERVAQAEGRILWH